MRNGMEAEVVVVGGGPAGLAAAVEAAKAGAQVLLFDENRRPGGQLFKQIHKFFGSREHFAGVRGFVIGKQLLDEVKEWGVTVALDSLVYGIFQEKTLGVVVAGKHQEVKAQRIVFATGAMENVISFPGSTLPGVMGAGAAQTMINVNRVLPGRRVLTIGSGNVGLIVSYQLLQAGAEVLFLLEALPRIGGYGVHAAKLRRAGVEILVSHTVKSAYGDGKGLEGATIVSLDETGIPLPGSEEDISLDTICLAVGLSPMTELAWMAGVAFTFLPDLGGHIPLHDENMETDVQGLYVAGDITGVEEASTAMEEGRLAGLSAAESLGYSIQPPNRKELIRWRLASLRGGPFGLKRREAKEILWQEKERT